MDVFFNILRTTPDACSSMTRTRPFCSITAGTVRSVRLKTRQQFRLYAELTEFYFDFARLPDLVEHLSVEFGDCGFKGICNAFPTTGLQAIDESGLVGDAKRLCMGAQILSYMAEFNIGVQASSEMDEVLPFLMARIGSAINTRTLA